MATAPSNGREGDGKEHHSYSDEYMDPIQDWSSGREVPVVAIGTTIRSERLDLLKRNPNDQVVPRTIIAQPTKSSSSSEVEERYWQSDLYPAKKMKANQDSQSQHSMGLLSAVDPTTERPSLNFDSVADTTENQGNALVGGSEATQPSSVSVSDPNTGNHSKPLVMQQQQPTKAMMESQSSDSAGLSESIQPSTVSVSDPNTDNHNQLVMQQQQPTAGNLPESVDFSNNDDDTMEEMESDTPAQSSGNFSIMCRKCEKEKIDTAVLPCKHAYLCLNCAEHLKEQKGLCPHCSEPVKDIFHFSLPDN